METKEFKAANEEYKLCKDSAITEDQKMDAFFFFHNRYDFEVVEANVQFGTFGTGMATELQIRFENRDMAGGFGMIDIKELVFNLHENNHIRLYAMWRLEHEGGTSNVFSEVEIKPSGNYGLITECLAKLEKMFNVGDA